MRPLLLSPPPTRYLLAAVIALGWQFNRRCPSSSGTKAFTDFANVQFTTATITARGALIYNSTPSANDESGSSLTNPCGLCLDFQSDKTSTAGTFTVAFPTPDADNAIIRIASAGVMALVLADRIKETTTTEGTGTYTLAGAVTGFESFATIGNSNTTYYCCTDGTDFEVGVGTYASSGTTLALHDHPAIQQ